MAYIKTTLLFAVMTVLFVAIGYFAGGIGGMIVAFAIAACMNLGTYWFSDRILLSLYGAHEVTRRSSPALFDTVSKLARKAGLPVPKIYMIDEAQPNAFATGRDPTHAAIAVTAGLVEKLHSIQVAAVIAHELAHIRNRDTLTMTVTATFAGAISILAHLLTSGFGRRAENNPLGGVAAFMMVLAAPFVALLVQMAISREREFKADSEGALICGNPLALASALRRIKSIGVEIPNVHAEMHPGTAHLFIINPLSGKGWENWLSTHPSTRARVQRLEKLAMNMPTTVVDAAPWFRSAA